MLSASRYLSRFVFNGFNVIWYIGFPVKFNDPRNYTTTVCKCKFSFSRKLEILFEKGKTFAEEQDWEDILIPIKGDGWQ